MIYDDIDPSLCGITVKSLPKVQGIADFLHPHYATKDKEEFIKIFTKKPRHNRPTHIDK